MKKKKMESGCDGDAVADRISGLPDSILHTIFSSIDMYQVVQTSVLSRKWRNFWKSTPNLSFDAFWEKQSGWGRHKPGGKVDDESKAMSFFDRVLLLRDNSSNIQKLYLCFINAAGGEIDSHPYRIVTWLIYACIRGVQEVHLEDCFPLSGSPTELPSQVFTTLKVFKLHSCGPVRLPSSLFSSPHLRILKLVSLTLYLPLPEVYSNGELELSCPTLEDLVLDRCLIKNVMILKISAHQLNNLVVEYCDLGCEIKICTPSLTSLKLWSSTYKNYSLKNLSSLVSCRIGGDELLTGSVCSLPIQSLMKILNGVTNVSTLQIYGYSCTKDTLLSGGVYDELVNPFPNLTHLWIELSTGYSIRATVNLLRCSPSIKTLVWDAKEKYPCSERELEFWGELLSFQYSFDGLKHVKALNLQGTDNELKFLEFLLKNAVALKNVKITFKKWIQMDKKLNEFMKKLHSLPKASPGVEIFFSLTFEG